MRSLRQRPVEIANQIRLTRSQHPGPFLVVEGRDDRLFCERYTLKDGCRVLVAGSKNNVLEVIRILEGVSFPGVLGIVDPDFDVLEDALPTSPNVVTSDAHDLEISLLNSPALDRVLIEFGSRRKVESLGGDVRSLLFTAASRVGYLRWLSKKESLGLTFQGLKLAACVDRQTLEVDSLEVCRKVKNLSRRSELDEAQLDEAAAALSRRRHDIRHVCCGDDAMQILSVGLRRVIGTNRAQHVSVERLRSALRLAFEDADLELSALGEAIWSWECRNPGFRVLMHGKRD